MSSKRIRVSVVIVLSMIWACSSGPAAQAHAIILESAPRHEESVGAPKKLVLRFNSRLEKPLCSVQLVGPRQWTIALLRPEPDTPPDTLAYPLPALEPGVYQARWKVMAADGHVTEGTVLFTVVASQPARAR
jgi:methionine-rich copper-binding protein CopC